MYGEDKSKLKEYGKEYSKRAYLSKSEKEKQQLKQ